MDTGGWVGIALAGAAALLLLAVVFLVRLRTLGLRVGSFECAVRTRSGWASGIAHYGVEDLCWYRIVSLSPRPARTWRRAAITVVTRTERTAGSGASGVVEVDCDIAGEQVSLAMRANSYSGFASWLESLPPREYLTMRS